MLTQSSPKFALRFALEGLDCSNTVHVGFQQERGILSLVVAFLLKQEMCVSRLLLGLVHYILFLRRGPQKFGSS